MARPTKTQQKLDLIGVSFGNYVATRKLGEGGMGAVFLAAHPHIGKKVAVKVLHATYSDSEDVVKRFFDEAKAVNDIGHSNIVDISDFGLLDHPEYGRLYYFIMEYLDGLTLKQLTRRDGRLPPARVLGIASQIADALAASHRAHIIHRDLKPDNIILQERDGRADIVKILDFGIAKLSGDNNSSQTRAGIVLGTPAYMSPEQCEGKGRIDHRTDIYSLGIVMYEMVAGRVPFTAETYGDVLIQHLTRTPERPSLHNPQLPPAIEAVILKALEKRPDNRYPNMTEFAAAINDPAGYVNRYGGLHEFTHTPIPGISSPSRPMAATMMASPGQAAGVAPPPMPPSDPTTMSSGAGQLAAVKSSSGSSGLLTAMVVLLALGGGGYAAYWMSERGKQAELAGAALSGGDADAEAQGHGTPVPAPDAGAVVPDAALANPPLDAAALVNDAAVHPATITLTISSKPKGAKVKLGGKLLGVTNATFEVPWSDAAQELVIESNGYVDYRESLTPTANIMIKAQLSAKPKNGSTKPKCKPGDGETVDVFADDNCVK
ncbi:MAG: serine/threonine protein kinase [Myxococcales bacterium]|nr:serine/threonine protein kinase [Myxococcales bacterium]